jgi:4-amino-4-deoxy-L-arabinose transferase-like glycosyltransferase
MLRVSLIFELLRSQPRAVFWLTTLTQAALWWLTPSIFYSAPPGELPLLLAAGHEFQIGNVFGPPLASWLAEIAFDIAGLPGVYLLSQVCVVATFWAVYALARSIVGVAHATIAIMLMVGITVFNVPTPEFGEAILAMPITALMLLHFWRALGEGRRGYWSALALETGLLLMTSYTGLIICFALVVFTVASKRGRTALTTTDPWIAGVVVAILLFPHLIWLDSADVLWAPLVNAFGRIQAGNLNPVDWVRMIVRILLLHGGFLILILMASGWRAQERGRVPVFLRAPVDPFARLFVYYHAIAPVLIASIYSTIVGEQSLVGGTAPLVVLSSLAAVIAAGDIIRMHRQRTVGTFWGILLLSPPALVLLFMVAMPWVTRTEPVIAEPAVAIGRFFSENFARRTGKPLAIVVGEPRLASLVALYSRPRASLYLYATPEHTPWVTPQDIARKGAIVVWVATDTVGTPPADIKARFPDLVPDVPRAFERFVQGRAPLLRVGWGIVRPTAN